MSNSTPNGGVSQNAESQEEQFTPVFDSLVSEHNTMTALVFGVIWRHCQRKRKVCDASIETMAQAVGVGRRTIERCIKVLVAADLIIDQTPQLRHKPHTYVLSPHAKKRFPKNKTGASESRTSKAVGASESRTRYATESHPGASESRIRIHHEDTKEDTSSSCAPESPEPKTIEQAHGDGDDVGSFLELMDGLGFDRFGSRSVIKARKGQTDKILEEVNYLMAYLDAGGQFPAWVENKRKVTISLLKAGDLIKSVDQWRRGSHWENGHKSDVSDFTQDKQYKFFAELEAKSNNAQPVPDYVDDPDFYKQRPGESRTDYYLRTNRDNINRKLEALHRGVEAEPESPESTGDSGPPTKEWLDEQFANIRAKFDARGPTVHDYAAFSSYNPEDGSYNL